MTESKTVYLIDAFALIYRSYYAFIRSPRINSKGLNVSAIFGFVNTIVDLLTRRKPDYLAVAFDTHAPTFRHEMFDQYKANREAQPEDIRLSMPYIKQFLAAMNITILECQGYEADDIIGTLSRKIDMPDATIFLMTPDKDYAQLVGGNVKLFRPSVSTSGGEEWGRDEVCEHFGIKDPLQIIDLLGLWGDSSDNIPGCPGVGEKRAKELLAEFGTIDGIYQNIEQLKGKLKSNLADNRPQVELSRTLATIVTDAPIEFDIETAKFAKPDMAALAQLFDELEFRNVMQRINALFNPQPEFAGSLFDAEPAAAAEAPQPPSLDTAQTIAHEYTLVTTDDDLRQLAARMSAAPYFCFDTETTMLSAMESEIVGMSVAFEPHKAYYVPFEADRNESTRRLAIFREAFASENVTKIGQNMKYDLLVLRRYGIEISGRLFDTMIAHSLLFPGRRHNMDDMSETILHYRPIKIETLIGKGAQQISMRFVPLETVKEYAAEDADVTLQLFQALRPQIEADDALKHLFENIEMPLMTVLADMEYSGVRIDSNAMDAYSDNLRRQIDQSEAKIKEYAGCDFNISSPRQVGEVLFDKLKIDPAAKKNSKGFYATNEDTLQRLASSSPIVSEILNYRGLMKLLNTYAVALPKLVNPLTRRIHTSFNQAVVITGRLSSTNPNLQNIPIRDANGREIRKAFIPTEGNILVSADYSQVELRIMAHFSEDEHLIAAFRHGDDIHAATAARIFKVPIDEVTSDMRRKAKTANFGIIYGISAFGLAERLSIPRKEAKDIIDGYFISFPGVKRYMERCTEDARTTGAVKTLFGRRRELEGITSKNSVVRGVAERNAINAPIQGTAADIIKIAMVAIDRLFKQENLSSKMILQVHDELVFDVCPDELERVIAIVKHEMENACTLRVPLVADIGQGSNWLEAH